MYSNNDLELGLKYKDMVGFYNIENFSNNTLLYGDTTFNSYLYILNDSFFDNKTTIKSNLYVSGNTTIEGNFTITSKIKTNDITINNNGICNEITTNNIIVKNNMNINNLNNENDIVCDNSNILCPVNITNDLLLDNLISPNTINILSEKIIIGNENSIINLYGTTIKILNNSFNCLDKLITINGNNNGENCGIQILSNIDDIFIKTNNDGTKFTIKGLYDTNYKYITTFDLDYNLSVISKCFFNHNFSINSSLEINNNFICHNNITINNNLNVSKNTTINNNITVLNNLQIINDINCNNKGTVLESLNIKNDTTTNNITVNSDLIIKGETYLNDNISINSDLHIHSKTLIEKNVTVNNTLNLFNDNIFYSNLSILNESKLNNIYSNNNIIFDKNVTTNEIICNDKATINSNLYIYKNANINNNFKIDKNLFVKNYLIYELKEYSTNKEAAFNNIPIGGFFRTGGIVRIRLDITLPIIDLKNIYSITVKNGNNYIDPGIIVYDESETISYLISISNENTNNIINEPIDVSMPISIPNTEFLNVGTYQIQYKATDIVGNNTFENRILIVEIPVLYEYITSYSSIIVNNLQHNNLIFTIEGNFFWDRHGGGPIIINMDFNNNDIKVNNIFLEKDGGGNIRLIVNNNITTLFSNIGQLESKKWHNIILSYDNINGLHGWINGVYNNHSSVITLNPTSFNNINIQLQHVTEGYGKISNVRFSNKNLYQINTFVNINENLLDILPSTLLLINDETAKDVSNNNVNVYYLGIVSSNVI